MRNKRKRQDWQKIANAKRARSERRLVVIGVIRHGVSELDDSDRTFAESLIRQFLSKNELTDLQWAYALKLAKRIKERRRKDCCLYVIGIPDGPIKIGISVDPERRMAALQTSSPYKLSIEHREIFPSRGGARLREKRLHKKCKRFGMSGEWFSREAFAVVLSLADPGSSD